MAKWNWKRIPGVQSLLHRLLNSNHQYRQWLYN
jgi:hypothetical protein